MPTRSEIFIANEYVRVPEYRGISPEDFLRVNRSRTTQQVLERWKRAPRIATWGCGDARARSINPYGTVDISSIAAGGPRNRYGGLFESVSGLVKITHFDCGGEKAKAQERFLKGDKPVFTYIREEIKHRDPSIQAMTVAYETSLTTPNPVLATVLDHTTGVLSPLAIGADYGRYMRAIVPIDDIVHGRFVAEDIYKKSGVATLDEDELPEHLQKFLDNQRRYIDGVKTKYPDFTNMQQKQNPEFVFVTAAQAPGQLRYKEVLEKPGSYFQVHTPQTGTEQVTEEMMRMIEAQVQYPLDEARFSNTHTLVIETHSLEESAKIGRTLQTKAWVQDWQQRNLGQILAAEVHGENTTAMHRIAA